MSVTFSAIWTVVTNHGTLNTIYTPVASTIDPKSNLQCGFDWPVCWNATTNGQDIAAKACENKAKDAWVCLSFCSAVLCNGTLDGKTWYTEDVSHPCTFCSPVVNGRATWRLITASRQKYEMFATPDPVYTFSVGSTLFPNPTVTSKLNSAVGVVTSPVLSTAESQASQVSSTQIDAITSLQTSIAAPESGLPPVTSFSATAETHSPAIAPAGSTWAAMNPCIWASIVPSMAAACSTSRR